VWLEVRRCFFTDELRPSAFPSSVIPPFIAISVGKTKKPFADGFTDGICAPKKRFSLEIYRRIFIPSVILWLTDGNYQSINPLVSVWNTDRIYPFVNSSVLVAATVKCRRINSVGKSVDECLKYRPNSSIGKILGNSFFLNFFLKNYLGCIIYKLIVIQTNYANKIYIKHKKTKLNNIHYKLNMFQEKY
jgi:hypothetical protein